LALACYTKAIGICFLGRPRSDFAERAGELSKTSIVAQCVAASASLILGVSAPYIVPLFQPVSLIVLPKGTDLHNVVALPLFTTVLLSLVIISSIFILLNRLSLRPQAQLKKYITWDCGYGDLPARAEETGASFSESIARIFAPILQYRMITEIQGKDRRHFPEVIKFETVTSPLLEEGLYRPSLKIIQILSRGIAALQTGSIHLYLVYVFITLVVLVSVGIRL
jgi:hydrogenase-4 component B